MNTYKIFWLYYGIRGNEEGITTLTANSPEEAAEKFYRHNRPACCDDHYLGFEILDIEEERE